MKTPFPVVVQKYGGSSVATADKIKQVARFIQRRAKEGNRLCVVVSAMGKTTDQLLAMAHEVTRDPSRRELDMLLSCGERASMAILAMALEELGCPAVSLTGSQSGIITSDVHSGAKILEVRPHRVQAELDKGKIVIVAGFQGVSIYKEITTLGRGGSDTTAVAMAAALSAASCEIYSDVPGVFTADPKWIKDAVAIPRLSLDEMEELSLYGAKVMHSQALQFAKAEGITIHALKTATDEIAGTLISPRRVREKLASVMLAHKDPVYHLRVSAHGLEAMVSELIKRQIFHMQLYGWMDDAAKHWHCLIHPEDAHGFEHWSRLLQHAEREADCSTVSLVGAGLCEMPKITAHAIHLLSLNSIDVLGMSMAPNRCTFALKEGEAVSALQLLHHELVSGPDPGSRNV